jgi:hypothetical protein
MKHFKLLSLCGLSLLGANLSAIEKPTHDFDKDIKPILDKFCIRCHGERKQKGDVRLDLLNPDYVKGPDAEAWHAALDVINTADMPPDDVKQPSTEERRKLVDWMTTSLKYAKEMKRGKQSTVIRRLTKAQYNNSLKDILGVEIDFSKPLPPDPLSHMGFSNSGKTLNISPLHIEYYQKIAREALTKAIGPAKKPPVSRYQLEFGNNISKKVHNTIRSYQSVDLSGKHFHTHIYDAQGNKLGEDKLDPTGTKVIDIKKSIMVDFRGSDRNRFGMAKDGVTLYSALPHVEKAPKSWQGASPNLKMLIRNHFPAEGDFIFRVNASKGDYFSSPANQLITTLIPVSKKDKKKEKKKAPKATLTPTLAKLVKGQLSLPKDALRIKASDTSKHRLLKFAGDTLVSTDRGNVSRASYKLSIPQDGYYQIDVLHSQLEHTSYISVAVDTQKVKLQVEGTKKPDDRKNKLLSSIAFAKLKAGTHNFEISGEHFLEFSDIILSPLGKKNSFLKKNESERLQIEKNFVQFKDHKPSIQAFLGNRGDDGMDHKTFDVSKVVDSPNGQAATYEFKGRLENLPIPVVDPNSTNKLANIMIVGLYNDHLVKSKDQFGSALTVHSVEFEAPYFDQWPTKSYNKIFFDSPWKKDKELYTREVIKRFISRSFRQPASAKLVDRYFNFWKSIRADYTRYEDGVKEALIAVLCSPEFLYLSEPENKSSKSVAEIELASRLSYFLWNSPPDTELIDLAKEGKLEAQTDQQIERMINDPKIMQFIDAFSQEWLRLDRLDNISTNIGKYPSFTRFVKRDMALETHEFLRHALQNNLSILNFIESDFAMLNQNLAEFYGIDQVEGNHFRPVPIKSDSNRGGLLSQASFLTGHSNGTQAHPIKRGIWLMSKLLDDEPPPPPPNVPALDVEAESNAGLTIKQQLEKHREDQSCRDCHLKIDPWGVVFENYDAVGLFDPKADATTELLDGTPLNGIAELKSYLLKEKKEALTRSVIKHLLSYSLGRELSYMDNEDINDLVKQVQAQDYGFQDLLKNIIKHDIFRRK